MCSTQYNKGKSVVAERFIRTVKNKPEFHLVDHKSRITVDFKIFVDQFRLFFIKFTVQNTSVVQIRG